MNAATLARLRQMLRGIPRQLASVRAGSILIIVIFAFTLAAAFFPYTKTAGFMRDIGQNFDMEGVSRIGVLEFQERFESPPFIALTIALGLCLCLSLYFRVRNELRRWRAKRTARLGEAGRRPQSPADGAAVATICRELKRRGFSTHVSFAAGTWQIHGEKGDGGVLGSLLFHMGILLVLVAVLLSATASFRASVKLTEGQSFDARVDAYGTQKAGRWYTAPREPLTFRLVRVDPDYEVNGARTVASIVQPTLGGTVSRFLAEAPVYINNGLEHAGVTIHQGRESGYAPMVVVENAMGKRLLEGYTRLATMAGPERESYLDYVYFKDRQASLKLELLPDAAYRNGVYVARSGALKKPVLHAVLLENGNPVFDQFVPVTRDVSAGGYTVYFGGVRRWSQIDVSDAPGVPVLIAATLLGSLGLALRLLRVRRHVVVTLLGETKAPMHAFNLTGASEKFQRQFQEELENLRAVLAERLAAPAEPVRSGVPAARSATAGRQ